MTVTLVQDELDQVLGDVAVRSVYQPIMDLATGRAIGFEALARGPEGSRLENPAALFAAARDAGRLSELDWACRVAALQGALDAGMTTSMSLFVNVEPDAAHTPPSPEIHDLLIDAGRRLNVVIEVTERALVHAPAELLAAVRAMRDLGWGVALDDVGAEIASLALMPFLGPDVIKLDLSLVQQRPDREVAAVIGAVVAQAERTGALVLAEGIETPDHLATALGMGATLGQGWLFGRPGPLPDDVDRLDRPVVLRSAPPAPATTPMAAASRVRTPRRATKPVLLEMSFHLERQAMEQGAAAVVLSCFQTAARFTPGTRDRYRQLAAGATLVCALGTDMAPEPAPGVRGGELLPGDPLIDEWGIAVVGPHFAGALAAIDVGDDGPDELRRFDYVLTYDRDLVIEIADSLMARVHPLGS